MNKVARFTANPEIIILLRSRKLRLNGCKCYHLSVVHLCQGAETGGAVPDHDLDFLSLSLLSLQEVPDLCLYDAKVHTGEVRSRARAPSALDVAV